MCPVCAVINELLLGLQYYYTCWFMITHGNYTPPPPYSTTVEELGSSFTVGYTVGSWKGKQVRDSLHIDGSSFSVTFDLIKEAYNGFFVAGAQWVGIWGMAFSGLAKVRCVCVCVRTRVRVCMCVHMYKV